MVAETYYPIRIIGTTPGMGDKECKGKDNVVLEHSFYATYYSSYRLVEHYTYMLSLWQ